MTALCEPKPCPLGYGATVGDMERHLQHHKEIERARQGANVGSAEKEMARCRALDAEIREEIERGARTVRTVRGDRSGQYWSRGETYYRVAECDHCQMRRARLGDGEPFTIRGGVRECERHVWHPIYDSRHPVTPVKSTLSPLRNVMPTYAPVDAHTKVVTDDNTHDDNTQDYRVRRKVCGRI